jgi:hypothetical protein
MLLRGGATVIATTRFPVDSALRFLRRKTYRDGTSFKNSWIGFDTFECRDFLQFYRAKYERLDILQ